MSFFKRIGQSLGLRDTPPSGPPGAICYAIGDVHGRLDLLDALLAQIDADLRARRPERAFVVQLGDLIDRGPDSAAVIDRMIGLSSMDAQIVCLLGNHEEVMLRVLEGDEQLFEEWMRFGGEQCIASYGLDAGELAAMRPETALDRLRRAVPREHVQFLRTMGDTFRFGDYLLVHAGIRPGISIDRQNVRDLRWMRDPFLSDTRDHGVIVVHGHTIVDAVGEHPNRIAIDTGAYRSGRLTALVMEGAERRFLAT